MKTKWDYTELANAYLKRPAYAKDAIDELIAMVNIRKGDCVCDVGAGAAHLTLELAARGLSVSAIEPNDAMRANGIKRTQHLENVKWFIGVGENTGMQTGVFDLVTFGSSFNVCDRLLALKEAARILKPSGWFACMWNWRNLDDPLQKKIEEIIALHIPSYHYGTRREEQTEMIDACGLFGKTKIITGTVVHHIKTADFAEGWKSHATLQRQSKDQFDRIIDEITDLIQKYAMNGIVDVPYTTKIWVSQLR